MDDIKNNQRLINVHLKVATGASEAYPHIVGHDLSGDHRQRFGLGRVDFAGHDRRARFILRDQEFSKASPRTARHQPDVIADLVKRNRKGTKRAGELDQSIMSTLHGELIRRAHEG